MSKQDEKPAIKSKPEELKPPEVWCFELGLHSKPKLSKNRKLMLSPAIPSWQHGAASALHCWEFHEHHANGPMLLSKSDYLAALKAAEGPSYKPHPAALSPHAPWAPKD